MKWYDLNTSTEFKVETDRFPNHSGIEQGNGLILAQQWRND
ncbi:hypothetical protein R3X25_11560 [Lutibacter sp. TH_r2]|nr:hypothetical protein [Lutibacter sp. TH_r2]MDV7187919.1 hypothetical protein [Lutibacter sp. TH_r2]